MCSHLCTAAGEIQMKHRDWLQKKVESLVTLPVESAINGTPGVSVRSSSAASISVVRVILLGH